MVASFGSGNRWPSQVSGSESVERAIKMPLESMIETSVPAGNSCRMNLGLNQARFTVIDNMPSTFPSLSVIGWTRGEIQIFVVRPTTGAPIAKDRLLSRSEEHTSELHSR